MPEKLSPYTSRFKFVVKVIGAGESGNAALNYFLHHYSEQFLRNKYYYDASFLAMTDNELSLETVPSHIPTQFIDKQVMKESNKNVIQNAISGVDFIILCADLSNERGAEISAEIARIAQQQEIKVLSVAAVPLENAEKEKLAKAWLDELARFSGVIEVRGKESGEIMHKQCCDIIHNIFQPLVTRLPRLPRLLRLPVYELNSPHVDINDIVNLIPGKIAYFYGEFDDLEQLIQYIEDLKEYSEINTASMSVMVVSYDVKLHPLNIEDEDKISELGSKEDAITTFRCRSDIEKILFTVLVKY